MAMVTPAMPMTHVRTLLANVDVIQGPLILLSVVALDPAEPCCTGPEHREHPECFIAVKCLYCLYQR